MSQKWWSGAEPPGTPTGCRLATRSGQQAVQEAGEKAHSNVRYTKLNQVKGRANMSISFRLKLLHRNKNCSRCGKVGNLYSKVNEEAWRARVSICMYVAEFKTRHLAKKPGHQLLIISHRQ